MSQHTPQVHRVAIALPAAAPLVRITAGAGSPGQKTWNLRRPVTLIGSRRPASIVLHDRNISAAHCVIVNTGSEVLLKDLHTSSGTRCNKEQVDLALLKDGDVIVVGDMSIQVAIQVANDEADDSGCGVEFVDPTKFPETITLGLAHTDTEWLIEDAVTLIGRHPDAAIRLDNEAVSTRHALLFRFASGAAIFELGSRTGITINGEECTSAMLSDGDRIAVGPCVLRAGRFDPAALDGQPSTADEPEDPGKRSSGDPSEDPPSREGLAEGESSSVGPTPRAAGFSPPERSRRLKPAAPDKPPPLDTLGIGDDPDCTLERIESQLGTLQKNIAKSWGQLNSWETQLQDDSTELNKQESDLETRGAKLDARDAALRGQLHDLTRYQEEIAARERELAAQLARIQAERDELSASQTARKQQEAQVERRAEELQRREHVLAQRWTRLLSATCPHCSKPVNVGRTNPEL